MKKIAACLVAAGILNHAYAAQFTQEGVEKINALIQKLDPTSKVISTFDGPGPFAGTIVKSEKDEKPVVIWGTPDGEYLIAGNLFEAKTARNLTDVAAKYYKAENPLAMALAQVARKVSEELVPEVFKLKTLQETKKNGGIPFKISVSPEKALELAQNAAKAGGGFLLKEGKLGTVYVFADMDCPHCHAVHPELMKLDANIVYLPVQSVGDDDEIDPIFRSGDPEVVRAYMDRVLIPEWKPIVSEQEAKKRHETNRKALETILGGWIATPVMVAVTPDGKTGVWMGESVYQVRNLLMSQPTKKAPPASEKVDHTLEKKQPNQSK